MALRTKNHTKPTPHNVESVPCTGIKRHYKVAQSTLSSSQPTDPEEQHHQQHVNSTAPQAATPKHTHPKQTKQEHEKKDENLQIPYRRAATNVNDYRRTPAGHCVQLCQHQIVAGQINAASSGNPCPLMASPHTDYLTLSSRHLLTIP